MADQENRRSDEDRSGTSTRENSPPTSKNSLDITPTNGKCMTDVQFPENKMNDYENKINKLQTFVVKLKKAVEQKNDIIKSKVSPIYDQLRLKFILLGHRDRKFEAH